MSLVAISNKVYDGLGLVGIKFEDVTFEDLKAISDFKLESLGGAYVWVETEDKYKTLMKIFEMGSDWVWNSSLQRPMVGGGWMHGAHTCISVENKHISFNDGRYIPKGNTVYSLDDFFRIQNLDVRAISLIDRLND